MDEQDALLHAPAAYKSSGFVTPAPFGVPEPVEHIVFRHDYTNLADYQDAQSAASALYIQEFRQWIEQRAAHDRAQEKIRRSLSRFDMPEPVEEQVDRDQYASGDEWLAAKDAASERFLEAARIWANARAAYQREQGLTSSGSEGTPHEPLLFDATEDALDMDPQHPTEEDPRGTKRKLSGEESVQVSPCLTCRLTPLTPNVSGRGTSVVRALLEEGLGLLFSSGPSDFVCGLQACAYEMHSRP